MDAEVKSLVRREQGNYDAAVRNIAAYILQKNKNGCLLQGKKMAEAKRRVEILHILSSSVANLKNFAEPISKGVVNSDVEQLLLTICCSADIFKADGLNKFKNTIVKEAYKAQAPNFSHPEKLNDPLKSLFQQPEPSDEEIVAMIRSDVTKFCRDPKNIDTLFGAPPPKTVQQPKTPQQPAQNVAVPQVTYPQTQAPSPQQPQTKQQKLPSSTVSYPRVQPASAPTKKFKDHTELFPINDNKPFERDQWPALLAAIRSAN